MVGKRDGCLASIYSTSSLFAGPGTNGCPLSPAFLGAGNEMLTPVPAPGQTLVIQDKTVHFCQGFSQEEKTRPVGDAVLLVIGLVTSLGTVSSERVLWEVLLREKHPGS